MNSKLYREQNYLAEKKQLNQHTHARTHARTHRSLKVPVSISLVMVKRQNHCQ